MHARLRNACARSLWGVVLLLPLSPGGAASAQEVVASQSGKVYHSDPECPAAGKIAEENRVKFKSAEEAEAEGRRLCKMCEKRQVRRAEDEAADGDGNSEPDGKKGPAGNPESGQPVPRQPPKLKKRRTSPAEGVVAAEVRVRRVLAGGTIVLDTGEKVRLMGVEAPLAGQPFAPESVSALEKLTRGRPVRMQLPSGGDQHPLRDVYGRLLVYLAAGDDGLDVGSELIRRGWAWGDRSAIFDRREEYAAMELEASASNRGVWKRLEGEAGRTEVVGGKYAWQFHPPDCPHVEHLIDPAKITLNEARAKRLTPCEHYRGGAAGTEAGHGSVKGKHARAKQAQAAGK